jgi:class 3 adenylate cyclase
VHKEQIIEVEPAEEIVYRLLIAVDIQGYTRRDAREQLRTQRDLSQALDRGAAAIGLNRSQWEKQVGGDGELAMLPENVHLAPMVGEFPLLLADELALLNQARGDRPRLRIRLALHHGTLTAGPFGPAGEAPIVVQRLLDSAKLRRALKEDPSRDIAYAVSDSLFDDVIRTGFTRMPPTAFTPTRFTTKGVTYRGYVHTGELPQPTALVPRRHRGN